MTAELTLLLILITLLIGCSALFSGLEAALFALKPHQLKRLERHHPSLANFVVSFRENPRRVLNVLLLGDVVVNVPLIVLCLVLVWKTPLALFMPGWLAALAIFAIIVLVCDLIPKLLALAAPYRLSTIGAATLRVLMPTLGRAGDTLQKISEAMVNWVRPVEVNVRDGLSDQELETLVELGEEQGALQEAEGEMIQEIIKLGDKTVKDCMTPRVDMFSIPDDLTNDQAVVVLRERRLRRVPVHGETPDDILGIIDVKAFLLDPSEHYTEVMLPPSFLPETMRAMDLLRQFLSHPQRLAVVVDEFGGVEGIITLSDFFEEILSDAAPLGDAELYIEPLEGGRLLVSGDARLDDLREHLGFELEAEGIDTIGGLVFNRLGYVPSSGSRFDLPMLSVTVQRASRKRIRELLLEKTTYATAPDEPEDNGEVVT